MNAHTPGPWIATQRTHTKGPPSPEESHLDYFHIMAGRGDDSWELTGFMRPSDAHLIAAAPDLLEALKELLASQLAIMPPFEAGKDAQNAWSDRRAKARNDAAAVIAKAEGQS